MPIRRMLAVFVGCLMVGCQGGNATPEDGTAVNVDRLRLTLPAGWQQVPPSSKMRVAQAVIPGSGGSGELTAFFFGPGQGGDIETNLARWIGQMEVAPGTSPHREVIEHDGLRITWIDVQGLLKAGQMGMGPSEAQPNSRLLGAVIEGDGGPWFLKLTGPDETMAPQRDAFLAMLRSTKLRR